MLLSKETDVTVECFQETINRSLEVLEVLIHQTKVKVYGCNVRMVFSAWDLENVDCSVHVLESLGDVSACMMIQSQVAITVSSLRMIVSQDSFLKNDALSLKFNCLEEVTKLELNASQFRDAWSYVLIHGTCDLQQGIDALRIKFKSLLKVTFFVHLLGWGQHLSHIIVLDVKVFDDWEHVHDITNLEWQVLVSHKLFHILRGWLHSWRSFLLAWTSGLLAFSNISLRLFGESIHNLIDIIIQDVVLLLMANDLNTYLLAQVSQQWDLIVLIL